MTGRLANLTLTKKRLATLAIIIVSALAFSFYNSQNGLSYKEVIVALGALIASVIIFGGESGIRFGLVLWVLTLALGYRTIEWTQELRIHPAEILLWLLLLCVFAQRKLVENNRLSLPWWLLLSMPFWALAWWPLIIGDAPWDKMLNEFRDFVLLIPLMVVTSMVLNDRRYWRYLLVAFFAAGTWIALMGVVEYWLPGLTQYFPAFIGKVKPVETADNFARAQFSFWGGAAATFICALTVPLAIAVASWTTQYLQRLVIGAAAVLHILAIYIGGYRSVWFLLVLQILVGCLLGLRKRGVLMAMLVLVIAIGGYQFVPNTHDRLITGIAALRGQPIDHSAQDRKDRALQALNDAIAQPLGNGWASAGWVHSDFFQIAANLGILAALIFMAGYGNTLMRVGKRVLSHFRFDARDDLGLALLLSLIAAGGMLLMEGVEVLPQMALPVWFVWILCEVWLRQTSVAPQRDEAAAQSYYPLMPVNSLSESKVNV